MTGDCRLETGDNVRINREDFNKLILAARSYDQLMGDYLLLSEEFELYKSMNSANNKSLGSLNSEISDLDLKVRELQNKNLELILGLQNKDKIIRTLEELLNLDIDIETFLKHSNQIDENYTNLKSDYDKLLSEKNSLNKNYDDLESENQHLKGLVGKLTLRNYSLVGMIKNSSKKLSSMKDYLSTLFQKNTALQEKLDESSISNSTNFELPISYNDAGKGKYA